MPPKRETFVLACLNACIMPARASADDAVGAPTPHDSTTLPSAHPRLAPKQQRRRCLPQLPQRIPTRGAHRDPSPPRLLNRVEAHRHQRLLLLLDRSAEEHRDERPPKMLDHEEPHRDRSPPQLVDRSSGAHRNQRPLQLSGRSAGAHHLDQSPPQLLRQKLLEEVLWDDRLHRQPTGPINVNASEQDPSEDREGNCGILKAQGTKTIVEQL